MKKVFLKVGLKNLKNEEWFNFHLEFKGIVMQATPSYLGIEKQFAQYLELLEKADAAIEQIRKSALTDSIKRLDALRDSAFRALKAAWKYGLAELDPAKREAAERLGIIFNHFGNLAAKPYKEATASIVNFLQELRGQYAPDAELLNLAGLINRLEEANNTFESTVMARNSEVASRSEVNVAEIRHETDRSYDDLLKRIEAQALLDGSDRFDGFIRTLNVNIERYKHRRSHRKDEGQEESLSIKN